MYILKSSEGIVGWDLETGEHGVFTFNVQEAIFITEEDALHYMDLLERKECDTRCVWVEEV